MSQSNSDGPRVEISATDDDALDPEGPGIPAPTEGVGPEVLTELLAVTHQLRQRVLNLERAMGHGMFSVDNTAEWNRKLESRFIYALEDHYWGWHIDKGPRFHHGQKQYEYILYLASLLPVDRLLILWTRHAKIKMPEIFLADQDTNSV
jgi:hypothetical protein